MTQNQKIRLANLKKLVDEYNGPTRLAEASGKHNSYFSHLFAGRRKIGDKFCRDLELALNLKSGWMDS